MKKINVVLIILLASALFSSFVYAEEGIGVSECKSQGESIPVIANPPECCEGLDLIKPLSSGLVGISGYCTSKCGDDYCDDSIESTYNCSADCERDYSCWSDRDCESNEFCYLDNCLAETGNCLEKPEVCIELYAPVCGCDGKTYSNSCFMQGAGVSLDYSGKCEEEPLCVDKCGNGVCDEIVCQGTGCPCSETPTSCPEDCASGKCIGEGEKGSLFNEEECCYGLYAISNSFMENGVCIAPNDGSFVCSNCGNERCESWENSCNCPKDCKEVSGCVDKCGNGVCDEIVCQGTGCPCSETEKSCPKDCAHSIPICNNDGNCKYPENAYNCPRDCGTNDREIQFNEEFKLGVGDKAILKHEDTKIVFRLDRIVTTEEECDNTTNICRIGRPITALITVEQHSGNVSTGTQIKLREGESQIIFGVNLENLVIGDSAASFIVTKNNIPGVIFVKLDELFGLNVSQTAAVQEDGDTVLKLTLEELIEQDIYCIKAPCPSGVYAVLSAYSANGWAESFRLRQGDSQIIGDKSNNYTVTFKDMRNGKPQFVVSETTSNPHLTVKLGEDFILKLRQTAIVSPTRLEVTLAGIEEQKICYSAAADVDNSTGENYGCTTQKIAKFRVKSPIEYEVYQSTKSEEMMVDATGTISTEIAVDSDDVDVYNYPYVYVVEGQSVERFGYKFTVHGIASDNESLKMVVDKATIIIDPEAKDVKVDSKFDLKIRQTANVHDEGTIVFKMKLNDIVHTKCGSAETESGVVYTAADNKYTGTIKEVRSISVDVATTEIAPTEASGSSGGGSGTTYSYSYTEENISKCIGGSYARVTITSKEYCDKTNDSEDCGVTGTSFTIKEGEKQVFGNYVVRLLSLGAKEAVFIVEKHTMPPEYKKVKLDEKFRLERAQVALVVNENVSLRLNEIAVACYDDSETESGGCDYKLLVSVWKMYETNYSYDSDSVELAEYSMRVGEELNLYGLKIKALDASDNFAAFVVTKKNNQGVINVHVGERFKLTEEQAARVLEANMRIDVLGITSLAYCEKIDCDQTFSNCVAACEEVLEVEFSVSNYLFEQAETGKNIKTEAIEGVIVGSAVDSGDAEKTDTVINIPPMPFKTFSLQAGEEVQVGDYTIKVVDLTPELAVFIVEEESSGIEFEYKIKTGWNLFGYPGELDSIGVNNCDASSFVLFHYNGTTFEKISEPKIGHAYWLYNRGNACNAKVSIKREAPLHTAGVLRVGWNFIPVTPAMGTNISDLVEKSGCTLKAAYRYDAANKNWDILLNSSNLQDYLGEGIALYSSNACVLGGASTEPDIPMPGLPEVN